MAIGSQVALSATAAALNPSTGEPVGEVVTIKAGASAVLLGGAGVTASGAGAGFSLAAGATLQIECDPGDVVYGILATGTDTCYVLRNPRRR